MAMDMLKRTIELLANSTVSTAKNYFSNADQIVTDSKQIYTGVKDAVKKPVDFVRGMLSRSRGGGIYKLVNDWFYQRSNEFDSFDLGGLDDDDDFDAGFGDNGGDEEEEPSASLDTKAMKDIARGQVGAMYQIGQKQTEASLANTAEIVTTFNSRSSEIVAAITNMTKSIINIDKNLTTLSKAYAQTTAKNQYSYDEESNPFSGGQLTLGKMADALKNTVSDNMYVGLIKMGLEGMKQGGPGFLTDMLVEGLTEKLKIEGKSLRDHADSLNEKLGNFMHEQFSKLIDLDFVKDWIGDFGYLSRNISGTIANDYTRNKATFDGMTRKTIVEIIPQYLSKITTALTGQIYNIDKKGKLTTKNIDYVKDSMSSSVTRNAFSYDIMSTSVRNGDIKYKNRTTIQINDRLLQQIQQWLTTGYVAYCFSNYGRVLPYSKLLDNEVQRYAIKFAWKSYKRYYGGTGGNANDYDSDGINKEFAEVCSQILGEQLFTNEGKAKFEQGIQSAIDAVRNSGRKLGQEGFDLGSVNDDKLLEWQDSYFRTHSAFKQISDKKKEEIESSMEKSEEYINAKRKLNQGKLPGVLGGGEKKSREVLQLESIKDDVNALSELIKDAKITENGVQRAATTADLFKDGKVSEFGLLRIMIKNAIDAAANDEENLPQSEVRRTLYDNDYKGNIGSLIQDIYKHLTEGVTKVTIVNPPSDAGSGGIPSRLNLNTHGCGPVALSDLATRMNENGMYDPNRGTTVGDYIAAASGMGMNLHPGKATQRALRGASRNHPITVLGSGYGYGTATGQLHYMNIIGSDDNGNLFTSNPMYGNGVFPAGAIANNSVLGLFGSGDDTHLTEEERKVIEEAKSKVSELGSDAKKKLEAMDQESTVTKLLYVLGLRSENIDKATGRIQSGFDKAGSGFHKGRGIINRATDKVNEWIETARGNISEDIRRGIDVEIGNINRRADAIKEGNEYADSKKKAVADDKQISDEDKQLADQALSLMQAALQDGDGTSDLNAIKKVINKIQNNDLRQDLMNNVTGLINRSRQKEEVKPKTKIGKFILFGIGLLKKMFSPVIKGVKLAWRAFTGFLKGAWSGVKKFGKPIMKFLLSPYIRGAAMVSVGAKSLKEGLFGKKTTLDDGTVVKQSGIFGELGKGLFGYREKNADGSTTRHKGLPEKIIRDVFTMTLGQPKALINKLFGQYKEGIVNKLKRAAKDLGEAFGKAGSAIGKFVATTAKWTFKITKFIVTAPFKLIGTITKKLSNFVKKAGPVVKDFFKVGLPNFAYFTKQFISDKWKELKESKFGQGVKKITDKISGTKTFKNVTGTLKAVAGGALDFGKGFAGGWLGTAKDARKKGQDRIDKIFGDKKGGSDAQKTATAIADSNKTNTENLIKSNTEHTKSIMDSFKEGVSSIIEFFRGQKEEEKKEQEEANKKQDEESKKEEGSEESKKQGQNTPVLEEINENQDKQKQRQNAPVLEEINENQDKQKQRASENNTEQTQNNNNESTTESNNNSNNNDTSKVSNDQQKSGGEGEGDGNKKASPLQRIGGLVGKIFSGVSNIFGGITKIVMTAAMQLSGFKTLVKLVKTIITTAIKPLNKLFKQIVKAIKPIIKTLTTTLTQLVDSAVQIISTLLESITPFLEPLFNVVSDIFGALGEDLISIVGGLIKLLNPLVEGVLKFLIPAIKFIQGLLESIIGGITMMIGKFLYGIGNILKWIPSVFGKEPPEIAITLMTNGNKLAAAGGEKLYTGIARIIDIGAPVNKVNDTAQTVETTATESETSTVNNDNSTTITTTNDDHSTTTTTTVNEKAYEKYPEARGMSRDAVVGTYGEDAAREIYGSGDSQASYGTFLNMKERGCGPVALADAINRRNMRSIYGSGDAIDSATLARSMYNAGTYDVSRGTSVRDYIMTGASLGYGMTAGGVNQRSLKQASPTNPITLVGSGTGFGTRQGNTHYINVVGSGNDGFSYVSNPLTGRVSRVATNDLVLNSKLGIYGSGDEDEEQQPELTNEQIDSLVDDAKSTIEKQARETAAEDLTGWKKIGRWLSSTGLMGDIGKDIFDSMFLDVDESITDAEKKKFKDELVSAKNSGQNLSNVDLSSIIPNSVKARIETEISEKYMDSESQNEYRKRQYQKYLIEEKGLDPNLFKSTTTNSNPSSTTVNDSSVALDDINNIDFSAEAIADKYSFSTTISSLIGGLKDLASNFLSIFNTDDLTTTEGQQKYLQRLKKEIGEEKFNKLRAYAFIKFAQEHPPTGFESLEADTTGGKVYGARFKLYEYKYITKYKDAVLKNENWKPTAAELQMAGLGSIDPDNAVSHIISLLGGLESDGTSTISSGSGSGYGSNSASMGYDAQGRITTSGTLLETKNAFKEGSKYAQNPNVGAFIDKAKNAGMTPAEIATIISTGIWEDGGEKIFGNKSITATTYDYNGQRAEGIMNWVGGSHATTVAGQLAEIHEKYFNPGSYGEYAKFRHNEFDNQDTEAYKTATGRSGFTLNWGDKYGNIINTDLIEGSEHFFRSALVPESIHNPTGVGNYVGTAVGAYNWMLDKGYFVPQVTSGTTYNGSYSTPYKPRVTDNDYPEKGNIYYNTTGNGGKNFLQSGNLLASGTNILWNCSGYALGRFHEMINDPSFSHLRGGTRNGGQILKPEGAAAKEGLTIEKGYSANPQPGDIISWTQGSNGHVAIVEQVKDKDNITISHSGYRNRNKTSGGFFWRHNDLKRGSSSDPWHIWNGYHFYGFGHNKYLQSQGGNTQAVAATTGSEYDTHDYWGAPTSVATQFGGDGNKLTLLDQNNMTIGKVWDFGAYPQSNAVNEFTKKHPDAKMMGSKWQTSGHQYWLYDAAGNITGAGDTPTSSVYIPPIDSNSFLSDALLNQDSAKSVNNYYVAKDSSDEKRQELNILLNHTFNVRSESMEAILTEMLEELRKRGSARQPVAVPSPATTPSLFDNDGIPPQIDRLIT